MEQTTLFEQIIIEYENKSFSEILVGIHTPQYRIYNATTGRYFCGSLDMIEPEQVTYHAFVRGLALGKLGQTVVAKVSREMHTKEFRQDGRRYSLYEEFIGGKQTAFKVTELRETVIFEGDIADSANYGKNEEYPFTVLQDLFFSHLIFHRHADLYLLTEEELCAEAGVTKEAFHYWCFGNVDSFLDSKTNVVYYPCGSARDPALLEEERELRVREEKNNG